MQKEIVRIFLCFYLHDLNGFPHKYTLGELHMNHGNGTRVGVSLAQVDETPQVVDGIPRLVYE